MKKKIIVLNIVVILLLYVQISSAIETRNEDTAITLTITTKDKDAALYTPAKITWRLDDVASGNQIKDDTNITPSSASTDVTIAASYNAIIDDTLSYEEKLFTFEIYVGTTMVYTGEYRYRIKNLEKAPL